MEQLTISLGRRHTTGDMLRIAKNALDKLERTGVIFLPVDPIRDPNVYCEMLHDDFGRYFRYVRVHDPIGGGTPGRIDIRYDTKAAS